MLNYLLSTANKMKYISQSTRRTQREHVLGSQQNLYGLCGSFYERALTQF